MNTPKRKAFANLILPDWEDAVEKFFSRIADKAKREELSPKDVYMSLLHGYGQEIADEWAEWYNEGGEPE